MNKALRIGFLALIAAIALSFLLVPRPVEEQWLEIAVTETYPGRDVVRLQSAEMQAALVDLAIDELTRLKAEAAMLAYPDLARRIFPIFSSHPGFRQALRDYGEAVLPPIAYMMDNPVRTIEWLNTLAVQYQRARRFFSSEPPAGNPDPSNSLSTRDSVTSDGPLTAEQRAWYAIEFINAEGHDFIGQFRVDNAGKPQWIQSERISEGIVQFFSSGIRTLETRVRMGEDISVSDVGWATVDVLIFASAVKVLRGGKAVAQASRGASLSSRSASVAARMIGGGSIVLRTARYARWPVALGAAYLVVRHPSLISSALGEFAGVIGWPQWLVLGMGWFLILLPVIYLFSWLLVPASGLLVVMSRIVNPRRSRRSNLV